MKRVIAILLLVIFIAANSGMAMTIHYCKGKVSRVELGAFEKKCCCKKMPVHHCCTSKTTIARLKGNFFGTSVSIDNSQQPVLEIFKASEIVSVSYQAVSNEFIHSDSSPPLYPEKTILNQVFRI